MTLQELISKQDDLTIMKSDVIGRVKNTRLYKKDVLFPLFEAIINSIDAINDGPNSSKGQIAIHIKRDQKSIYQDDDPLREDNAATGFVVVDNGVGFNEKNFISFLTSDSRLKENRGGKGIGRFMWLKAFSQVHIESSFVENNSFHTISFDFLLNEKPIQNLNLKTIESSNFRTEVKLEHIIKKYEGEIPDNNEKIALRILEHFLIFFLSKQCPEIVVAGDDEGSPINLNEEFDNKIKPYISHDPFTLKKQKFNITYLRLHSAYKAVHAIRLCADQREVTSDPLSKLLPDLAKQKLYDDISPDEFNLVSYVSGDYLDKNVNHERTDFDFPEPEEKQLKIDESFEISKQELLEGVVELVRKQFEKPLVAINRDKMQQFEKFVSSEKPIYRPLLKYATDDLKEIPASLPKERLDIEMHKLIHKLEIEVKEEGKRFFDLEKELVEESPEYEEKYYKFLNKIEDLNAGKLAEYVMHRKTILHLLEQSLGLQKNGKYPKENRIHRLLYPPKTASDDNAFINHNLWIIDEKLTYHTYLASDLPFNKMSHIESESEKRPDILIYPTAFVDESYPYNSIVIIEIKRPERKDYSDIDKDPIQQVVGYIKDLKTRNAKDEKGVIIPVRDETRFYCYIIADMTSKLKGILEDKDYNQTIDADGYFYFHKQHRAYIEVISFRKLLEDSKKRNQVLFEQLGLPA